MKHILPIDNMRRMRPECGMNALDANLVTLAQGYARWRGVSLWRVGHLAANRGSFFVDLREDRRHCQTDTYSRVLQWFSDRWPPELALARGGAAARTLRRPRRERRGRSGRLMGSQSVDGAQGAYGIDRPVAASNRDIRTSTIQSIPESSCKRE